ncbi:Menaquinone reductase, integral membrane subunit [Candidatus Thermoflexus japonica]|uniref:Menaquinone reductase, integral membrane subunit n=1 Tax=Candidatus Thermoflexus japonica TaxID=2035417 RepID=A0A2H5Y463_9CHLR|nr:Menaquinone reductase, integral membrane subunit [Candidatus Thermoflexus japonica]
MNRTEKILWGIALVGFLAGIAGLIQRFTGGHTVAAYGTYVPWGLWVAVYTTLVGISIGSFLIAALGEGARIRALQPLTRIALLTAFAALAGGLLAIWLDLGHPLRFWKLFLSTNPTSIMGWMAWFYTAYGILLLVLIYLQWARPTSPLLRLLFGLGLALAVIFGGAEGALFGVVSAQALWESALVPIRFLIEGAASGMALVLFLAILLGYLEPESGRFLRWTLLGLLLTVAVLEWSEYSTTIYAGIPTKVESLRVVLFGPFWWVFWIFQIGLGLVAPIILLAFLGERKVWLGTAGGLIAFTSLSAKLNLVIPALVVPELEGLRMAFTGPGLSFDYFPTLSEWLLAVWVVSVAALIFLAAYRLLPAEQARHA